METLKHTKQNDVVAIKINYKGSKNEQQPMKTKTNKYTRRLRYITNT